MKRSTTTLAAETLPRPARPRGPGVLDDAALAEIEQTWSAGLTSREIIDVLAARGIHFSEATLRKYVQYGLLPRSIRVGRKGKHKGSRGIYPANVIRRVNVIRRMMAENLTIEDIQKSFVKFKDDIDAVELGLRDLIGGFEKEARGVRVSPERRQELELEIEGARAAATELVRRIAELERRLSLPVDGTGPTVGGGNDLF